jgi:hypothetical protein
VDERGLVTSETKGKERMEEKYAQSDRQSDSKLCILGLQMKSTFSDCVIIEITEIVY